MDFTAEGIVRLYKQRDNIKGLKFIFEPKVLRFFQASLLLEQGTAPSINKATNILQEITAISIITPIPKLKCLFFFISLLLVLALK